MLICKYFSPLSPLFRTSNILFLTLTWTFVLYKVEGLRDKEEGKSPYVKTFAYSFLITYLHKK